MGGETLPGKEAIEVPGFSYLPGFITAEEGQTLLRYFGSLKPLWESRYVGDHAQREGQGSRRLTRPVYWLGAWQFACLGYYAAPDHLHGKCVRAEPLPEVMQTILQRLAPKLAGHSRGRNSARCPTPASSTTTAASCSRTPPGECSRVTTPASRCTTTPSRDRW